jgi:hypothetical protein
MLREAFKEEALSQARVYEWFSWFKHDDVAWRPTAIWASFNKQNRQKHSENLWCDNVWSSLNYRQVGSIDWSFMKFMSTNFNRRTSHETSCCEIHSRRIRKLIVWMCAVKWKSDWNWSRLFVQNHHRRWIMVLWVWPRDKATIKSMEKCIISKTRWYTQTTHNKSLYSSSLHFASVSKLATSTINEYKNAKITHLMLHYKWVT